MCNFNNTCGHKHDGCLAYQKSAQNLDAYRQRVRIFSTIYQSPKTVILAKISVAERNFNLICNSSLLTHMPKIIQISEGVSKKSLYNCDFQQFIKVHSP